jgi:hypothetical protein
VYKFIHSTAIDTTNASALTQALATGGTMTAGTSSVSMGDNIPGTVRLANEIKVATGNSTVTVVDAERVVPTVQAVVKWVADHGGGSTVSVASINDWSSAGIVYVSDHIPDSSAPTVTVPTLSAVYNFVTGSSIGNGIRYPNYASLDNDASALSGGITYYVTGGGWLRVTTSSTECCCVTIDEVYNFGLGNVASPYHPMTWLIPIGAGHKFYVTASASVVAFDGSCNVYSGSKSNSVASNLRTFSKMSGITKYDPNDPSTIEDEEPDIMERYTNHSTTGSKEDLAIIRAMASEAEDSKNNVITQYEAVRNHTTSFVTNSNRARLCADHVSELCSTASELYAAAMEEKDEVTARTYLEEADQYAAKANTWVAKCLAYVDAIQAAHEEDSNTDYLKIADDDVATAEARRESILQENEDLIILDITGGSFSVSIAERAAREAAEWYVRVEEELENNGIVYERAYALASEAYDDASSCYEALVKQADSAKNYVNNLGKPQQR